MRSFELAALILAWGVAFVVLAVLRLSGLRTWHAAHLVTAAGVFAATTAAVYSATGKRDVFLLYGDYLDSQSGNVRPAEIVETPTFSLLVPTKLVQLFVEPCYYSLCQLSDYAGGASLLPAPLEEAAGNERLWRLPLAQLLAHFAATCVGASPCSSYGSRGTALSLQSGCESFAFSSR